MALNPLNDLRGLGRDLNATPLARVPSLGKAALIVVNSYTNQRHGLGEAPVNDALGIAKVLKKAGYEIWFMHDPHERTFLIYFGNWVSKLVGHGVFYYSGFGPATVSGVEVVAFDDGNLSGAQVYESIAKNKAGDAVLTLVSDSCYSGSIFQLDSTVPGVLSIGSKTEEALTRQIIKSEQGLFTYELCKALLDHPAASPNQVRALIGAELRKAGKSIAIAASTPGLADASLIDTTV